MRIGADEAGKGPVLGPMVAAAIRADPAVLPADVDDSKRVSADRRREIAARLRDHDAVEIGLAVVEPVVIDTPETDMNTLTVQAQARAIREVVSPGDTLFLDAGDTSESRFGNRVRNAVIAETADGVDDVDAVDAVDDVDDVDEEHPSTDEDLEIVAEHGADETYPVVSAASIVAKVERDRRIDNIAAEYGEVGSGYPSDPTTRDFLERYIRANGDVPPCARRSWGTCTDLLADVEQSGLSEF